MYPDLDAVVERGEVAQLLEGGCLGGAWPLGEVEADGIGPLARLPCAAIQRGRRGRRSPREARHRLYCLVRATLPARFSLATHRFSPLPLRLAQHRLSCYLVKR